MKWSRVNTKDGIDWVQVNTEYTMHKVQQSLCRAHNDYCMHCILHSHTIDSLPLPASLLSSGGSCWTRFSIFPTITSWPLNRVSASVSASVPPTSWTTASRLHASTYSSSRTRLLSPSESPKSLDYSLLVRTLMASICVITDSLDHSLQVHHQRSRMLASMFARSWPPSAYLKPCTTMAFNFVLSRDPYVLPTLIKHRLEVYF